LKFVLVVIANKKPASAGFLFHGAGLATSIYPKNPGSHHREHRGHGATAQAHKIQAHPTGDMRLFRNAWFFLRDHRVLRGELLFPGLLAAGRLRRTPCGVFHTRCGASRLASADFSIWGNTE
jgi:hypothetical protein